MPINQTYSQAYLAHALRQERVMQKAIRKALNAFVMKYASVYQNSAINISEDILIIEHEKRIKSILEARYRVVIPFFSKFALKDIMDNITKADSDILLDSQDRVVSVYVLANALNRAKSIAKTSMIKIRNKVDTGIANGLDLTDIAASIRGIIKINSRRAETIARTEVHDAANHGSLETAKIAKQELNLPLVKEWVSTVDGRTRDSHIDLNGTTVEMEDNFNVGGAMAARPLDNSLPAEQSINCLLPDSVVDYASPKHITRRLYDGDIITIATTSGNKLSVTPNHPILTTRGWTPAHLIKKTDKIISSSLSERRTFANFDVEDRNASIEQVFNSLSNSTVTMRVVGGVVNFHGDATNENVDIVNIDSLLESDLETIGLDPFSEFKLPHPDFAKGFFFLKGLLYGGLFKKFKIFSTNHFVRGFNLVSSLVASHLRPLKSLCFTSTSNRNIVSIKHSPNRASGNTEFVRDGFTRAASPVFVDDIDNISVSIYSGFVYNLHDEKSYYICNGIVNHNCRCSLIYKRREVEIS